MAKTSLPRLRKPRSWKRGVSGHEAILVVIHESNGVLYLSPKPGGERVRQGCNLVVVAVNLTDTEHDVEIRFRTPIAGSRQYQVLSVQRWGVKHRKVTIPANLLGNKDVMVVPYLVGVGGVEVDPDLVIER